MGDSVSAFVLVVTIDGTAPPFWRPRVPRQSIPLEVPGKDLFLDTSPAQEPSGSARALASCCLPVSLMSVQWLLCVRSQCIGACLVFLLNTVSE